MRTEETNNHDNAIKVDDALPSLVDSVTPDSVDDGIGNMEQQEQPQQTFDTIEPTFETNDGMVGDVNGGGFGGVVNDDDDDDENGPKRFSGRKRMRQSCAKCMDRWPRMTAICCRVFLPLWLLVAISLGFGYLLSRYEGPNESDANDSILRNRFFIEIFPSDQIIERMASLPEDCLDLWVSEKLNETNDARNPLLKAINGVLPLSPFPDVEPSFDSQTNEELIAELGEYMDACGNLSASLTDIIIDYTRRETTALAFDDLTFNWNRCWNNTVYGSSNPFAATKDQVAASNNQSEFYAKVWHENQAVLYEKYIQEYNCTSDDDLECISEALSQSSMEATGSSGCEVNTGGSAWFWFTGKSHYLVFLRNVPEYDGNFRFKGIDNVRYLLMQHFPPSCIILLKFFISPSNQLWLVNTLLFPFLQLVHTPV